MLIDSAPVENEVGRLPVPRRRVLLEVRPKVLEPEREDVRELERDPAGDPGRVSASARVFLNCRYSNAFSVAGLPYLVLRADEAIAEPGDLGLDDGRRLPAE